MKQKILITLLVSVFAFLTFGVIPAFAQENPYTYELNNFNQSKYENEMLNYINQERQKVGVASLKMAPQLVELAQMKSQDMISNKYFSHTSPTYGSPFNMLEKYGVSYRTAGENLAGHYSVLGAHQALMNSAGHKKNILNPAFTHIGVGIVKGGPYGMMFTQLFIGEPNFDSPKPEPKPEPKPKPEPAPEPQKPANNGEVKLETQMLNLINSDRTQKGLAALKTNEELTEIARMKARDMEEKGYLGYSSPTYGRTAEMLSKSGISFSKLAESIVAASAVEPAHNALMARATHKSNILNSQIQEVGVGIVKSARYGYIMVEIFVGTDGGSLEPKPEPQPQPEPQENSGNSSDSLSVQEKIEYEMLELINKARKDAGVAPLALDKSLIKVARAKSQDMIDKNYFSHNSPTYGSPFEMLNTFGIKYRYAGENLAGYYSVTGAHEALMNSSGHRRNILNPNFTHIGIGIVEGGPYNTMFTQMFVGY